MVVDWFRGQVKPTLRVRDVLLIHHQPDAQGVLPFAGVALEVHPLAEGRESPWTLPGHVGLAFLVLAFLARDFGGLADSGELFLLEAQQRFLVRRLGSLRHGGGERPGRGRESEWK
jgi:hypothetical protein